MVVMQDLDKHQVKLLDEVAFDGAEKGTIFQRIGDRNQAIFDGSADRDSSWVMRDNTLTLSQSFRLNPQVSTVVSSFALDPVKVSGCGRNPDGSAIPDRPYLLIYKDNSRESVIPTFAGLIRKKIDRGEIPRDHRRFHAIAWNTVWKDGRSGGRVRLSDFFPNFSPEENRPRLDHDSLSGYFEYFDGSAPSLHSVQANIVAAVLKSLRVHGVRRTDSSETYFSHRTLFDHIGATLGSQYLDRFRTKIFQWSASILRGNVAQVLTELRAFIPEFLIAFEAGHPRRATSPELTAFLDNEPVGPPKANRATNPNAYSDGDIVVKVGSVHSVKGQTHTATLYLESSYYGKYEIETLAAQFAQRPFTPKPGVTTRQAARIVYVGLSRPTHLLVFAVHEPRFATMERSLPKDLWNFFWC